MPAAPTPSSALPTDHRPAATKIYGVFRSAPSYGSARLADAELIVVENSGHHGTAEMREHVLEALDRFAADN